MATEEIGLSMEAASIHSEATFLSSVLVRPKAAQGGRSLLLQEKRRKKGKEGERGVVQKGSGIFVNLR